jgi:hypothetical protein
VAAAAARLRGTPLVERAATAAGRRDCLARAFDASFAEHEPALRDARGWESIAPGNCAFLLHAQAVLHSVRPDAIAAPEHDEVSLEVLCAHPDAGMPKASDHFLRRRSFAVRLIRDRYLARRPLGEQSLDPFEDWGLPPPAEPQFAATRLLVAADVTDRREIGATRRRADGRRERMFRARWRVGSLAAVLRAIERGEEWPSTAFVDV